MDIAISNRRTTMLKKTLLVLGATAATLGSGLALAHPPHWAPAYGYRAHHRAYYVAPRPVYVVPAPRIVYAPPPPVVYPYYAAPAAVVAAPIAPGVSIRLRLPL
jgi:hypothetical protein